MTLEKLLNKLIEKGREPFGNYRDIITRYKYNERFFEFNHEGDNMVSIRELVSIDSGLWQFCCENKIVKEDYSSIELYIMSEGYGILRDSSYQFWLMSCSLKDESDLEQFLLDNIKIGNDYCI